MHMGARCLLLSVVCWGSSNMAVSFWGTRLTVAIIYWRYDEDLLEFFIPIISLCISVSEDCSGACPFISSSVQWSCLFLYAVWLNFSKFYGCRDVVIIMGRCLSFRVFSIDSEILLIFLCVFFCYLYYCWFGGDFKKVEPSRLIFGKSGCD